VSTGERSDKPAGKPRRERLLALGAIGVVAALTTAILVATSGPATAKQFGTLHTLAGLVEVRTAGQQDFHPGTEGEALHRGDTILTGPDGRAEIEYFDGSVTRLDFATEFTLTELASLPEREDSVIVEGRQVSGGTFSRVVDLTDSTSRFEVETPTAVASVRGTTFFSLLRDDGTTLWGVLDGGLLVGSEGDRVEVEAGHGVSVGKEGGLGTPFVLTSAQLASDFLQFNLCTLDDTDDCVEVLPDLAEPKKKKKKPTPEPEPEPVTETVTTSAPEQELQEEKEKPKPPPPPAPPPQTSIEEEPPPSSPPPEPPPPEPEPTGGPPCLNPGSAQPCDTPAGPGDPPGQGGTPPGQAGGNGNGNGKG
jgi:hypothetical protein